MKRKKFPLLCVHITEKNTSENRAILFFFSLRIFSFLSENANYK